MRTSQAVRSVPQSVRSAALFATAICVSFLFGCSNAGTPTCDQYAAKSFEDKQAALRSLLSAHHLKALDPGNTGGVTYAVHSFCGVTGLPGEKTANRNNNSSIDDAVDWSSREWKIGS